MATTSVSVDIPVRLQVMQDSINTLKRVLGGLKPESAPFKALENIIKSMTVQMEKFQIQTSKSFSSQQQFNQAGKSIDKMEESLARARLQLQNIKFSDLKLDKNQNNILEGFEKEFNAIDERVEQFKNQLKANILAAGNNSEILNNLMGGKAAEQSFDRLLINMTKKVQDFETQLRASQNALNNFNVEKITKAYNVSQKGITKESLGGDLFDKFFTGSLDTNDLKFRGGVGKGKEKFLEAFAQQFEISPEELKAKINIKGNAAAISEALKGLFGENGTYNNLFNSKEANYDKVQELTQNISQNMTNIQQLQGLIGQLKTTVAEGTPGAQHLEELQKQLDAVIVKEEEFQRGLVNSFKGSETATAGLTGINNQLASFRQQLSQTNAQFLQLQHAQQTFNSIKMAITNFMGFNQVLNLTRRAVQEAANHIKQLDTVMNGIAIVTDMTTADLWNQVDAYSEMAQRYGTTIQGAYEVSKIYYQAGYETNDVLTLMNETLKLSKISGLDYATTTDYMMTATRGFHMEVSEAAQVVDVYSALAANTAVSQQELAEAMSKTASSMESVGATFQESSAMIATMVAVTRESANNIGSALKSIGARYGELTKDPTKLFDAEGEAMSFNKVDTALKSVGISLQTTDHQFRDITDVIMELAGMWDTLDSAQQRYIATTFAGNRQQSRFLALVSNKDLLQENMDVAAASEDTGTLQALKALDSLDSKLNQVQVAYQQFYTSIGAEDVWKGALGLIRNFIDTLNGMPKVFGKIPIGAISIVVDVISTIKGLAFSAFSEIANRLSETIHNSQLNSQGKNSADEYTNGFLSGFKSRTNEIKAVIKDATKVDITPEEAAKSLIEGKKQVTIGKAQVDFSEGGSFSALNDNLIQNGSIITGQQFDALISKLKEIELISPEVGQALQNAFNKGEYNVVAQQLNQIKTEANESGQNFILMGEKAIQAGQMAQQGTSGFKSFVQNSKHLASDLGALGSAVNMIGTLFNTTSENGKIVAGSIMAVGAGFKVAQTAVLAFQAAANKAQWSNVFLAAAGAVLAVVNAIATLVETDTEKLERLTKEAETLNNEAKQAKADYGTLERSVKKLDELREARYDSAEATEEYQNAVDELAEKFPNLIGSFDEAGNVILNTVNIEKTLEEAREKSAAAAYKAAEAEYARIQMEARIAKANLRAAHSKNNINLVNLSSKNTGDGRFNFENANQYYRYIYGKEENFDDAVQRGILSDYQAYLDEAGLEASFDNFYKFAEDYSNQTGSLLNLMSAAEDFTINDEDTEVEKANKQIKSAILAYHNADSQDEIIETYKNLSNLILESDNIFQNAGDSWVEVYEVYTTMLNDLSEVGDSIYDLDDLLELEGDQLNTTINTWLKKNRNASENRAWNFLDDDIFGFLASNELSGIVQDFYLGDWESAKDAFLAGSNKDAKEVLDNLDSFYNDIFELYNGEEILTELDRIYNDRENYSSQDIIDLLTDYGLNIEDGAGAAFIEILETQYSESEEWTKEQILRKIGAQSNKTLLDELNSFLKENKDFDFTAQDRKYLTSLSEQVNALDKAGLTDRASDLAQYGFELFALTQDLDADVQKIILDSVLENGFATREGLTNIINSFEGNEDIPKEVINYLGNIRDNILENLGLAIQAATSDMAEQWENDSKNLSKLTSGMTIKEVNDFLEQAQAAGIEIDYTDFKQSGDKLVLSAEAYDEYWHNYSAKMTENAEAWEEKVADARAIVDGLDSTSLFNTWGVQGANKSSRNQEIFEAIYEITGGQAEAFYANEEYVDAYGNLRKAGIQYLQEQAEMIGRDADQLLWQAEQIEQQAQKTREWARGDYSSLMAEYEQFVRQVRPDEYIFDTSEFRQYLAGEKQYGLEDYDLKAAIDQAHSAYDSLISDVFSKGFENINLADYEGILEYDRDNIQAIIDSGNYEGAYLNFARRYASLAGYTVEETNDLIIQAIEKDSATTTGAAAEAIKDINFLTENMAYASLDTLKELADIYGVAVEELFDINDYNEALGGYRVNMARLAELGFGQIEDASATVKDSVLEFLKSIADAIEKGLQGKLDYAGMDNLIDSVSQYGIELSEADFTRTVDGLKLSDEAAIDLYRQLSAVDGLSGQIVFDAMRSSLEEAGKGFANISESSARIAELQREIAKQTKNIQDGQLRGAPKEWVDSENEKLNKLKQELQLAQEIQRAQSQNPDQYDFMGRDLPDYLKGPENYWNSTGEAFKAMRESSKSGYMEIDDFYNIINEMNNLAAISGQSFEFLGTTIDKEGQGAAQLIERGLGALSNVDGEGVKIDLSQLGVDFKTGAADMGEDFDDAVKVMAKSQIKMLDGMIQLLETVVAMEKLGDIDVDGDNVFSIGDLFKLDEEGNPISEYTKQYQQYATDTLEAAKSNTELSNALETFKINGISLKEMLEDATDGTKELNISEEAYFAAMNAVVTAAESGDYDPENWMSSIQEILAGTGQVFEIDAGDGTSIVIGYGAAIEKNEKGEYVYNGQTYDTAEEAAKVAALDGIGATDIKTEIIDEEIHVTGKITIGEQEIEVEQTKDGTIYKSDKTGGSYSSIDELIAKEFEADNQKDHGITLEEWTIQQGYKIVPEIDSSELELTPQQVKNLVGKTAKDLEKDASTMTDVQFQATYGVKWKQGTTDDVLQQVKERAGIESQNVELTLSVTTADDNSQKVLDILQTEAPSIPINVNINVNSDDTGLFGAVEGENDPTKDITVTLNNGESIDLAVTGVDTSTDTWTINGITATGETISLGQADISGLSFKEGWSLSSPVGQDGVDLGAATISNLNQNEDGSWTLDTVNGSISLTADEVSGLLDETLTLTKDATGNLILTPNTPDVDITTDAADATMEAWRAVQETKKIKQQVEVEETENPSAKSLMDTRLKIANIRSSESIGSFSQGKNNFTENVNWLTGRGNATQEAKDYLNNLNSIVESGQKLGSVDLSNLTYLQSVFTGVDSEAVSQINNLINMSAVNADSLDQTGQFLNSLAMVDIGQLPEIAVALEAITNQATLLQGVDWAAIAQGLTDVANAQTASNEAGAQANSLVDTSSLAVAVGEIGSAVDSVTNYIDTLKTAADQINDVAAAIETIKTDKIDAIQTAQNNIDHDKVDAIQTAQSQIRSDRIEAIKNAAATIDASHARAARDAINSIKNKVDVSIDLKVSASGGVSVGSVNGRPGARGNVALAKGTLMGELGEELVVSGGRYFLVGQTGPEFVDLAPDAIVFNHLQTKHLLQNGYSPTRGKPVTNDRKATSFATGNIDGPALASASSALAALKQVRAMWQRLLDASLKDLGGMGSPTGGGGGGGGGGEDDKKELEGITAEIEEWYNWLRRIDQLQKEINTKQKEYNNLLKDRVGNGDKIYTNLKDQIELMRQQRAYELGLAKAQEERRNAELEKLTTGPASDVFNAFYRWNDVTKAIERSGDQVFADFIRAHGDTAVANALQTNGQITVTTYKEQTEEEKKEGKEREKETATFSIPANGMDFLRELTEQDASGKIKYNAEQQFQILRQMGFGNWMQYDTQGKALFEKGIDNATQEEMQNAVETFITRWETMPDYFIGLNDSITEHGDQAEELLGNIYDNIDTIVQNQIEVENSVLKAIEDMRQAEIDAVQEERDAFADAADKMINGLNDALNKERQMYQNNENQKEVERLQRQLAILQRSGGSGSQIQNLQQQLASKQQDTYFTERQEQIDAIKEASDKQIEKMDRQIELMTETLDYQKENGLLWDQVYTLLQDPSGALQFILDNDKDLQGKSAAELVERTNELQDKIGMYDEMMRNGFDADRAADEARHVDDVNLKTTVDSIDSNVSAINAANNSINADLSDSDKEEESSDSGSSSGKGKRQSFKDRVAAAQNTLTNGMRAIGNTVSRVSAATTAARTAGADAARNSAANTVNSFLSGVGKLAEKLQKTKNSITDAKAAKKGMYRYATGGLNTEEGWAWLDGTPSRPEYVLNAEQTDILREALLGTNPVAASLNSAAYGSRAGMANGSTYSTISNNSGVEIENVNMTLEVKSINNDYDARRAGEQALSEMVRIARKSGNRSLSRR